MDVYKWALASAHRSSPSVAQMSAYNVPSSPHGWSIGGWQQPIANGEYEFRTLLPAVFARTEHPIIENTPIPPEPDAETRERLIDLICNWSFTSLTLPTVEVYYCACLIFESVLSIPELAGLGIMSDIRHFLHTLRFLYPGNPYHNFAHGVDVLQAVYTFLQPESVPPLRLLRDSEEAPWPVGQSNSLGHTGAMPWRPGPFQLGDAYYGLRPIEILAFLLAAVGHDVGHPGVSAQCLGNAHAPITAMVRGSPLEALHSTLLAQTLRAHGLGLVLSDPDAEELIRSVIMSTDMQVHAHYMGRFTAEFSSIHVPKSTREQYQRRVLICQAVLHAADISNPVRPFSIGVEWSVVLIREWTKQALLEAAMKLPLTQAVWPTLRTVDYQLKQAKVQVQFIDHATMPLFQVLQRILPKMTYFIRIGLQNRHIWQDRVNRLSTLSLSSPLPDDDFPYPNSA
ncbi:HD-domain/PDEase-like protein [Calocera viscosa TUFC12733]|uniref:HD-domain/PDEase-like protein n=1 Tax=Calocera viscosa (strain TUFC12733) TaxID=1330018 RepID=A0A167K3I0_CALVF|nr:HD-domain/PDEase-like protein [Calocera viscosa TUFC12733]